jgi:hypothetical protein
MQIPTIADEAGRRPGQAHHSFRDATWTDANRQVLESYSLATARMRSRLECSVQHVITCGSIAWRVSH